ncbi:MULTISPECIES: response regulator [Bifidobacterium]|uniref:response regulator n=1 Tax=Bifidobacterium TaxID=1678 RepID=UPI0009BC1832
MIWQSPNSQASWRAALYTTALACSRSTGSSVKTAAVIWSVTDGTDAVSRCLSERDRPEIVLVDMSLEGMQGPTVCRIVREHCSMMPIVAMTAFSTNMYRSIAARAGAQGMVSKNSEADFVEGVHEVICGRTYGGQLFESAAMVCARVQEEQRSSDRNLTQQEILVMELLSLLRECYANVCRHAPQHARYRITVRLSVEGIRIHAENHVAQGDAPDELRGGNGLGLHRRQLRQLGGSLTCSSSYGIWVTTAWLPISQ